MRDPIFKLFPLPYVDITLSSLEVVPTVALGLGILWLIPPRSKVQVSNVMIRGTHVQTFPAKV